ncbi:unnamed protein product [Calicophoron daubneyi]|uniref:Innexin n=1 Tax=Calicophoron daubneyi TaxID=300641 RepID=A0AAV2TX21_CALDB
MIADEFLKFLQKLHVPDYVGVEDAADKLSFLYSVLVLILCCLAVTVKQYLMSAIACYIPTVPSGSNFEEFLENYCWVHGTIPLLPGESIPQALDEWAEMDRKYRINYYQWVPFMLSLQCIMFYLPRVIWQTICSYRTGTDLQSLVNVASEASKGPPDQRGKLVDHIVSTMNTMLLQHREYRTGRIINVKRRVYNACGLFVCSKRLGTWLAFTYFFIKLSYLANAIGQLYLMQRFLGFNKTLSNFGWEVAGQMIDGQNWEQTRIFPRVSFCYLADIRQMGSTNRYVAQCVLPVNMLNEKVYIFLWYWTALVALCTFLSLPAWLIRLTMVRNRTHFIKKFLRINDQFTKNDKPLLISFTDDYLRHDGVFLLHIISLNAGDVITSEIVAELWTCYRKKWDTPAPKPEPAIDHVLAPLLKQDSICSESDSRSSGKKIAQV